MACLACSQRSANENAIKAINSCDEPFDEDDKELVLNKSIKVVRKPGSHHESVESITFLQVCNSLSKEFPNIDKTVISIPSTFIPKKDKNLKTSETDKDVLDLFEKKSKFVNSEIDQYASTKLESLKKVINSSQHAKNISNTVINIFALNSFDLFKNTSKDTQMKVRKKLTNEIKKYVEAHQKRNVKDLQDIFADCLVELILFDNKDLQQKWSSYTSRAGQKSEQDVAQKIIRNLGERPAMVLVGFRCWSFLHPLLQGLGISLQHAKDKNKDVEHDILVIVPTETNIEVFFIQVKASVYKPWKSTKRKGHNFNGLEHALKQTTKDIDTFFDITSILIKENLKKVSVKFFAVLHNVDSPENLCDSCNMIVIDKNDLCNRVNLSKKLNIPGKTSELDSEILALYKMLVGIYAGLSSLVPLKTAKEGYKLEQACLKTVREQYKNDGHSDAYLIMSSEQQEILKKRLHSYCLIGPYGGGKSLILELETIRMVREHPKTKDKLFLYISTGSWQHEKLLDHYKEIANELTIERNSNVKIRVASVDELWFELGNCSIETLPKSSVYNILTENLAQKHRNVCLIVDESIPTHPGIFHAPAEASGHFTLLRDSTVFDWTTLTPHPRCRLIMAVQTQNIINGFVKSEDKPQKRTSKSCIPTMVLKRDFRHSKRIKDFLSFACQQSFFYCSVRALPLDVELYGHEISGSFPLWYKAPPKDRYICKKTPCSTCFLPMVEDILKNILKGFENEDLPSKDIAILVNPMNTGEMNLIRSCLNKNHPNIKVLSCVQATGLDIPLVIALHHCGKYMEITEMWTRACSRLVIIGPDVKDTQILSKAAEKGFLKATEFKLPSQRRKISNEERKWSISTMEVSIKHLTMESHPVEPLPPKPLTRSRMVSWSLAMESQLVGNSASDICATKTRKNRPQKLITNRKSPTFLGKRRNYHKKDQGHLQRQRK